ncbi:MAG TPA: nitronate monooxygenase [Frankiaceae bacterium]|jgi:enoyl-[acyl-carrier protein] reductase II|nr:nitronate monooxygenase [Frankiaceae bacterium]
MHSRVADLLGIDIPIIQAPMGYIARAQLASAVSNAGGMGIVETSSGRLEEVKLEIKKMRDLTDKPWGVNIAQLMTRDPSIIDFVVEHGVRFVTTSAGDPAVMVPGLKKAGITVFHVVPTLRGAMKAIAAGVDGLVIEGVEGGGFKNPNGASTMVLVPLIAAAVDVPIVSAGGISDGISMAAAFTLGAEGVQMGTRMLTAAESPVHENWKQAVLAAAETDTVVVNRYAKPAMRTLRTDLSSGAERADVAPPLALEGLMKLYFGGEMNAAYAMSGQVAGRISEVLPVREILETTWRDCQERLREMGKLAG